MQGYANTIALKEYNVKLGATNNKRVKPVNGLPAFEKAHPAPLNSSGWYWPSVCELKYVCWGQGNGDSTKGKAMLDTQIGKVSGHAFGNDRYWSSTEYSGYNGYAYTVNFYHGRVESSYGKRNSALRVRPLLAF